MNRPVKVLIVDDEVNLLQSLSDVLKTRGYSVVTAQNGLEALEKLKERYFNVAIVDSKMPKMGGMGLLEVMKERYPQTLVVILTGYGTIKNAVEAMKKGGFLFKNREFNGESSSFNPLAFYLNGSSPLFNYIMNQS